MTASTLRLIPPVKRRVPVPPYPQSAVSDMEKESAFVRPVDPPPRSQVPSLPCQTPCQASSLVVIYLPNLNLTSSADNNCTFQRDIDPDQRSCVVPEGQPIRVQCSAVSNPEIANITWTSPAGLTNGQGGNGQLVIPSADRHAHNTQFICTATTGNSPPDSRLPLTNSTFLRVYVAYPSSVKALELNNVATNLTVNESDVTPVNLTCRSDGRPTPRTQLVRKHDGTVLKTVTGGSYTDVDDDTVVDHVISPARCEDTGTYMCVSDNQLGPEERLALSLFVNCKCC
ncbi:uncharacterized protein [Littorina saxatilis]|uniref:uncharacterized protein n=1 Tax=Littorina saxatilis TaxID=31220 RepID=UPI0038B4713E